MVKSKKLNKVKMLVKTFFSFIFSSKQKSKILCVQKEIQKKTEVNFFKCHRLI